jgi:dihydrofolate reductase
MRKLVISEFVSLDGVMEAPGKDGSSYEYAGWTMPYGNQQFMKLKSAELMAADVLLLGRVTYSGFAAAWPKMRGDVFSDRMNNIPKYIVTKTLSSLDWANSHRISDDLQKEVTALKSGGDGDILVAGSGQLARGLISAGLVDQIRLLVYPIVLGSGKRLFQETQKTALQLTRSEAFESGVVVLEYQPEK